MYISKMDIHLVSLILILSATSWTRGDSAGNTTYRASSTTLQSTSTTLRQTSISSTSTTNVSSCGTASLIANGNVQNFTSPGYPNNYPENTSCVWTFKKGPKDGTIRLVVLDSDIESDAQCKRSYARVYNGPDVDDLVQLQTWCGSMKPTIQSDMSSDVTLLFHTGLSTKPSRGFKLQYFMTNESFPCGGSITATNIGAVLKSPGYPFSHQGNMNCTWRVTADNPQDNIVFDVLDSTTEESKECLGDHIEVHDGSSTSSDMLARFCGTEMPKRIVTSGPSALILFHVGLTLSTTDFKLKYTAGHFPSCVPQNLVAGFTPDMLDSPNYPFLYPRNANCTWVIDTEDLSFYVKIVVYSSDIHSSPGCHDDYVEAFNGKTETAKSLGKWCGAMKPTKSSSGRYMLLKFVSTGTTRGKGFQILYSGRQCGLNGLEAKSTPLDIKSPSWPSMINTAAMCSWSIETLTGSTTVTVSSTDFSLPSSPGCTDSYIQIFDGTSSRDTSLGKWCGQTMPEVRSTGPFMYIQFNQHPGTSSKFLLHYSMTWNGSSRQVSNNSALIAVFIVTMVLERMLCL